MRHILSLYILLFACTGIYAQHTIQLSIAHKQEKTPLAGATAIIGAIDKTAIADSAGVATFQDIAAGTYTITISYAGLEELEISRRATREEQVHMR